MAATKELKKAGEDVGRSLLGQFADWIKERPSVWRKRREARRARRARK